MFNKLITVFCLLAATSAFSQEIKGIRLGMTREEVIAVDPNIVANSIRLTVAGVSSKYIHSSPVKFNAEGKVNAFIFFFSAESFDTVRDAFQAKYPSMKCVQTQVQDRMGASFTDETCVYQSLMLEKFVNDIKTSAISLEDERDLIEKAAKRKAKAASDL